VGQAGHEAAFRELVRRYERPLFSLLYRMVRDRALAEDLAQETFIKVLNGIKSYRPSSSSLVDLQDREQRGDRSPAQEESRHPVARRSPSAETPEQMRATSLQLGDRAETPLAEVESRELARRSSGPSGGCDPSTAPASCCATWRGIRTRKSRDVGVTAWNREDLYPSGRNELRVTSKTAGVKPGLGEARKGSQ